MKEKEEPCNGNFWLLVIQPVEARIPVRARGSPSVLEPRPVRSLPFGGELIFDRSVSSPPCISSGFLAQSTAGAATEIIPENGARLTLSLAGFVIVLLGIEKISCYFALILYLLFVYGYLPV